MSDDVIWFILIAALLTLSVIYWQITVKIGENQRMDREDYKREHPEFFKEFPD